MTENDKKDTRRYYFSAISGTLTFQGKPAVGAKLARYAGSKTQHDETITDENGYFEMPAVLEPRWKKYIPHQFSATHAIDVHYQGFEFAIISGVKSSPLKNAESSDKPFVITCELTEEGRFISVKDPFYSSSRAYGGLTNCHWEFEPFVRKLMNDVPIPDDEI